MDKKLAETIMKDFFNKNGPRLSLNEALTMKPATTNGIKVYVLQRDNVTFLAWERPNDPIYPVVTKTVFW